MRSSLRCLSLSIIVTSSLCTPALAQQWPAGNPYAPWLTHYASAESPDETTTRDEYALVPAPYAATDDDAETPRTPKTDLAILTPKHTKQIIRQLEAREHERAASLLEQAYSMRIVDQLSQFGYEIFDQGGPASSLVPDAARTAHRDGIPGGMAQDDFVLSSGDRLMITTRGQKNAQMAYTIDHQGFLIVDDITPIPAAGLTIAQVREILEAEASLRHNTQIFISLDAVRQIDILIIGHVAKPGRQTLSVFHTILDALIEAGGIEKTGSLRQVKLVRDGRSTYIDLYGLLVYGSANMDLQLRDGDRLIVPPIGPTVAIAGGVKRPGIYEVLPSVRGMHSKGNNTQKLSLEDMLELGGGYLSPGQNRLLRLTLSTDGKENVQPVGGNAYAPIFGDGNILMVSPSREARSGSVQLTGHTRTPGIHDLGTNKTLSSLIPSETVFGPDIYPLIGVIERQDSKTMARTLIDFSPLLVAKGDFDRQLEDGDVVRLFSRQQVQELQNLDQARVIEVGSADQDDEEPIDTATKSFLEERSVYVRGAVRNPGPWPVSEGASLEALISSAGGMTLEASAKDVEISSVHQPEGHGTKQRFSVNMNETDPAQVSIGPGDSVRVNQKFNRVADNSVLLVGEVKYPGRYDLNPGDTMADLLQRAGGMTEQAYPEGAIFSRESERKAEESRFRAAAREMERALAASMDKKTPPDSTQIAMAQELAAELKNVEAVGRITVEVDPGILSVEPELNILLESGDRIYVPKRPLTVRVNGEVLSPASLQFRKNKSPRDYIMEAGGFTYNADDDRAFVLYPDGSAQPLQVSNWNHKATMIPPGSTIVVPRDPKPFDFIQSAKDVSQILSNLAVTGIFLQDIRDDD